MNDVATASAASRPTSTCTKSSAGTWCRPVFTVAPFTARDRLKIGKDGMVGYVAHRADALRSRCDARTRTTLGARNTLSEVAIPLHWMGGWSACLRLRILSWMLSRGTTAPPSALVRPRRRRGAQRAAFSVGAPAREAMSREAQKLARFSRRCCPRVLHIFRDLQSPDCPSRERRGRRLV